MHRLASLVFTGEWAEMRGDGNAALELLEFAGRGGCADALALAGHVIAAGMIAHVDLPVVLGSGTSAVEVHAWQVRHVLIYQSLACFVDPLTILLRGSSTTRRQCMVRLTRTLGLAAGT